MLSALCKPDTEDEVVRTMLSHTTSLGLRTYRINKVLMDREFTKIRTSFGEVTMKTAMARENKAMAITYFERRHLLFALTNMKLDVSIPVSQITKADAKGKAACWQG